MTSGIMEKDSKAAAIIQGTLMMRGPGKNATMASQRTLRRANAAMDKKMRKEERKARNKAAKSG